MTYTGLQLSANDGVVAKAAFSDCVVANAKAALVCLVRVLKLVQLSRQTTLLQKLRNCAKRSTNFLVIDRLLVLMVPGMLT